MKNLIGLLRIGLLVLLITSSIAVASASAKSVQSCGIIYVGQTGVDVSSCVSGDTVAWWVSSSDRNKLAPTVFMSIPDKQSLVTTYFDGYSGYWYNFDPLTGTIGDKAFRIEAPKK